MHTITLQKLPPGELFYYNRGPKKYLLLKTQDIINTKIMCLDKRIRTFWLRPETLVRVRKTVAISQAIQSNPHQSVI